VTGQGGCRFTHPRDDRRSDDYREPRNVNSDIDLRNVHEG